ncbi:MAG: DUF4358 domain-containing protein [Oscillospiraceae bacterium]|nr:DUF4358 domain-containing protein [Oscillospiraceae bacterium]
MKRSKKITAILLTAFIALSMSACSGKTAEETPDNTTSADVQVASTDVSEIGNAAKKLYRGVDMIEITSDKMNFYFSDLDMSKVDSFYAVKAQDGYTDHFVMVKLNDNAYSSQVSDIFKAYASDLSETYADYAPIEADRAAKAQISVVEDNYVVLIISEDNSTVLSYVKSFFKN